MKKRLGFIVAVLMVGLINVPLSPVVGAAPTQEYCEAHPTVSICKDLRNPDQVGSTLQAVANFALGAIGIVAIILIVWSGLRMTIFQDNETKSWGKARNILLYAVFALVIDGLAIFILNVAMNLISQIN